MNEWTYMQIVVWGCVHSQCLDTRAFYLSLDLHFLAEVFRTNLLYLRQNWHLCGRGRPTLVVVATQAMMATPPTVQSGSLSLSLWLTCFILLYITQVEATASYIRFRLLYLQACLSSWSDQVIFAMGRQFSASSFELTTVIYSRRITQGK